MHKDRKKAITISFKLIFQFLLAILFCNFSTCVRAQGDRDIVPFGLNRNIYEKIPTLFLPAFDSALVKNTEKQINPTKEKYVAYNFKTTISPAAYGFNGNHSKEYKSFYIKLKSSGAYGIALVFSSVKLLAGEKLFIYNLQEMDGPYTNRSIPKSGVLPLDFLKGDEVVVEFDVPLYARETGNFIIETVSHAYYNVFEPDTALSTPSNQAYRNTTTKESDCYPCLEGDSLDYIKRAVVKLVVHLEIGTKLCTGILVNNTLKDKSPYILTAQHCISSPVDAERSVFTFNYGTIQCNTSTNAASASLHGASYLASAYENDFSLVLLNDYPSLAHHPYYAGWDITDRHKDHVVSIHHPKGGTKKVSLFQGAVTVQDFEDHTPRAPGAFWKVSRWDVGVTEGGSSGAPLFNKNHLVMGTLTGGSSECGSPFNDYFERLSSSWQPSVNTDQQLKNWLDPLSSGLKLLEGLDPFEGLNPECDTLSNIQSTENTGLVAYTPGKGYFSGYNSDSIASYAEKFYTEDSVMLTGSLFTVGSINKNSAGGIFVTVNQNDNGLPGVSLFETYIPYTKLDSGASNYIAFNPYFKVKGTFFISYTVGYSKGDIFALSQSPWRNGVESTAFVKLLKGWVSIETISPVLKGASFDIGAIACQNKVENKPGAHPLSFSLYPNPTTTILIINFTDAVPENIEFKIFDLHGKKHPANNYQYDKNIFIDTSPLSSGLYIISFRANGKSYHTKFIKSPYNH